MLSICQSVVHLKKQLKIDFRNEILSRLHFLLVKQNIHSAKPINIGLNFMCSWEWGYYSGPHGWVYGASVCKLAAFGDGKANWKLNDVISFKRFTLFWIPLLSNVSTSQCLNVTISERLMSPHFHMKPKLPWSDSGLTDSANWHQLHVLVKRPAAKWTDMSFFTKAIIRKVN